MPQAHPAIVAIMIAGLGARHAQAGPTTDRATIIDGDTLDIQGQRFRLQGVDTPESTQT